MLPQLTYLNYYIILYHDYIYISAPFLFYFLKHVFINIRVEEKGSET